MYLIIKIMLHLNTIKMKMGLKKLLLEILVGGFKKINFLLKKKSFLILLKKNIPHI